MKLRPQVCTGDYIHSLILSNCLVRVAVVLRRLLICKTISSCSCLIGRLAGIAKKWDFQIINLSLLNPYKIAKISLIKLT